LVSTFRRYVWATMRNEQARRGQVTVRKDDPAAGEEAQVDYGYLGAARPADGVWDARGGTPVAGLGQCPVNREPVPEVRLRRSAHASDGARRPPAWRQPGHPDRRLARRGRAPRAGVLRPAWLPALTRQAADEALAAAQAKASRDPWRKEMRS